MLYARTNTRGTNQNDIESQINFANYSTNQANAMRPLPPGAAMRRSKMPDSLRQTIKKQSHLNQSHNEIQHKSKIGMFFASKLPMKKATCEICEVEIKEKEPIILVECEHKNNFCQSCLHHYVIYKANRFEELFCPHDGCQQTLNQNCNLFPNLPKEIQTKCKKINMFYKTLVDPNLKLCPKEKCEGVIKIQQNRPSICNKCSTEFCSKCLFQKHLGDCSQNEVLFFQENLHFRQCSKCKIIIQKNQGCNHMTCRCGYQFCYICSQPWEHDHLCQPYRPPIVALQPIQHTQLVPPPQNPNQPHSDEFDCCLERMPCCCRIALKAFLYLFLAGLALFIGIGFLFAEIFFVFFAIFAGMCCFSVQFICVTYTDGGQSQVRPCWKILVLILIFPYSMVIGIKRAFTQICNECNQYLWNQYSTFIGEGCQQIADIN